MCVKQLARLKYSDSKSLGQDRKKVWGENLAGTALQHSVQQEHELLPEILFFTNVLWVMSVSLPNPK
jgi:hypothetical protein